jgi:hypothetical protein
MFKVAFRIGIASALLAFMAPLPSHASSGKTYKNTCAQQCEGRGLSGRSYAGCVDKCEANRKGQ